MPGSPPAGLLGPAQAPVQSQSQGLAFQSPGRAFQFLQRQCISDGEPSILAACPRRRSTHAPRPEYLSLNSAPSEGSYGAST